MNVEFSKEETNTTKALCDLLCRAYGMSAQSNAYGLNVSACALALVAKLEAAAAPPKPELVKPSQSNPADPAKQAPCPPIEAA